MLRGYQVVFLAVCLTCLWAVKKRVCFDTDKTIYCLSWRDEDFCTSELYGYYLSVNCNHTCGLCDVNRPVCNRETQIQCLEGYPVCVPIMKMCDGKNDCEDGWDETDCNWRNETQNNNSTFKVPTEDPQISTAAPAGKANATIHIYKEQVATFPVTSAMENGLQCRSDEMGCRKSNKCIKVDFWCDGWLDDCGDGEDEKPSFCYTRPNKDFLRSEYMRKDISVVEFMTSLLKMKQTHCLERHYSCRGACKTIPDLDSYLCACDQDCFARKDCCPDVLTECKYKNDVKIRERCIPNIFGTERDITALIVDQCPDTSTERDMRLCVLANKDYSSSKEALYMGAPVYSQQTGTHYRNYYCARCNGVEGKLVPWNIWYQCQDTQGDSDGQCEDIVYVPPPSIVKTCKHREFRDPSFDEGVVSLKQRTAIKHCQTVYAPVIYNKAIYRNPYCYFLHRSQLGDKDKTSVFSCDIENRIETCQKGYIPCRSTFSCLPESKLCDGNVDCPDGSDEPFELCSAIKCYNQFQCKITQHKCLEKSMVCDGFMQCPDGSDEKNCTEPNNDSEIEYRGDIYYTLPELTKYPTITNNYADHVNFDKPQELVLTKEPRCIPPLVFDGVMCKYNKTLTTDNQDYQKVYMKQDFRVITFNVTLTHTSFYRPLALQDNPPEFLMRHAGQYPYQVVEYEVKSTSATKYAGFVSFRLLTQLEQSEEIGKYVQSKRDKENFMQIDTKVYRVEMSDGHRQRTDGAYKSKTGIECEFKEGGPRRIVICTGCAYIQFAPGEYSILENGKIKLNTNGKISPGKVLHYDEYELRPEGNIIMCWGTPDTKIDLDDYSFHDPINLTWLRVWFGVGYSASVLIHLVTMVNNVCYGRKTTLRVFFISYNSMALIWSFDSLLCTVSSVYSLAAESLHLYGCLGTLAWLIIICFHLLLSISDANPAVYYSVDNLVYYHVCGWLCPFGWVIFFFVLSKCQVIDSVVSITDPTAILVSQASDILHFPVWVLLLVILFLLLTVIGITKRLLGSKKNTIDHDVLGCRLQIKLMIFGLFIISAAPWICEIAMRYWPLAYKYHIAKILFCLACLVQALYLLYMIRSLVIGDLEKLKDTSVTSEDHKVVPVKPVIELPMMDLPVPLPPKQHPHPPRPFYQRPVEKEYTRFPGSRGSPTVPPRTSNSPGPQGKISNAPQGRMSNSPQGMMAGNQGPVVYRPPHGKEKYTRVPDHEPDQYSHLHGIGSKHTAMVHRTRTPDPREYSTEQQHQPPAYASHYKRLNEDNRSSPHGSNQCLSRPAGSTGLLYQVSPHGSHHGSNSRLKHQSSDSVQDSSSQNVLEDYLGRDREDKGRNEGSPPPSYSLSVLELGGTPQSTTSFSSSHL